MRESSRTERGIELECLGRGPELIGYMAMSVRLSPSLARAITFAAKNMDGPISSALKRMVWNVYTRKFHSVEDSFTSTAIEWGKWDENLKGALFAVRSSTLEATEEGRERSLNKAMDIVLSGTKKKMEEFACSLSTPTTVLFALGILLPMILGAMLPMVSLGGLDLSYQAASSGSISRGGIHPVLIVLMMDVVFPVVAFLYSLNILSERPGGPSSNQFERGPLKKKRLIVLILLGLVLGILGGLNFDTFGSYLIVWGLALPCSIHLISTTYRRRKEAKEIQRLEEEFPDALFQLGTRISEGAPPEKAMLATSKSMRDTKIAELFRRVHHRTIVFGVTLENALFGDNGLLVNMPSNAIRATMRSFVEVAKKDSIKAGQMMIKTAEHLKDLQKLEEETKRNLKTSTETMKMTALFFAPIVMGVTFSLYMLLVDTFSRAISMGNMMASQVFFIVLGVYVILMAAVSVNFVSTIEKGNDKTERWYFIGIGVLISTAAYTVSSMIGRLIVV